MSAAAAALQSAACRALQRRHADSFRCALFAKEQRFPIQSTTIRRFYSSDCFAKAKTSTKEICLSARHSHLHLLETVGKKPGHEMMPMAAASPPLNEMKVIQRTFQKLDELNRTMDKHGIAMKELGDAIRDNVKRDRRDRLLLSASVLGGVIYMVQSFFGWARQEDTETTTST